MYLPGVTIYLTDRSFFLYPQVKPVFSGSNLNSKNRNDVTYFLKIETCVIFIGLIFFPDLSPFTIVIHFQIIDLVGK